MNFSHRVKHKLADPGSQAHCLVVPQQYLTSADLESGGDAEGAHSDLKINLYEKHPVKKALYAALKQDLLSKQVGDSHALLLEVKLANDVFTITMVLLGVPDVDGQEMLQRATSVALSRSLTANMRFKLAFEKWNPNSKESFPSRVETFVS